MSIYGQYSYQATLRDVHNASYRLSIYRAHLDDASDGMPCTERSLWELLSLGDSMHRLCQAHLLSTDFLGARYCHGASAMILKLSQLSRDRRSRCNHPAMVLALAAIPRSSWIVSRVGAIYVCRRTYPVIRGPVSCS